MRNQIHINICRHVLAIVSFLILALPSASAQVPFHKGINLTQWFQAASPREIQFTKFTKADFQDIKSLGCDVIRLPINLHAMTNGAPDYVLDPLFLKFLDQAVDWSEELDLYLILDNHSFDPSIATDPAVEEILVKVWPQLASHYKDRSGLLLYEILNEPHGIGDNEWGAIQQAAVDAIRLVDTEHYIIVGASNYNSYSNLPNLPVYDDDKLIYTFHFYDPFIFTHQGASWIEPSLIPLRNVPFPYQASLMPGLPSAFNGTWIQGAYNNYANDGTVTRVKQLLDIAVNFSTTRNVPVFCGEFGVYMPNSQESDRVAWYKEIRTYLNEKNIPWTMWDYRGGFGIFENNSYELFDYDLNVPLLEALAFSVPPQNNFYIKPQVQGLFIYDDYVGNGIVTTSSAGQGILDYYNEDAPHDGEHCIKWGGADQYAAIGFDFTPDVDFSLLPDHAYQLRFWVRGNSPGASFDVRFVDTKTGSQDHPWRMGKTIDETIVLWDGAWHEVVIPLADLEEKGSWDNEWFNPENKFDWSAIDRFEIVAEQQALTNVQFSFDEIQLMGEEIPEVLHAEEAFGITNLMVYPNPFSSNAQLEFSMTNPEEITISIFSSTGQQIRTLYQDQLFPGTHTVRWNGKDDQGERVSNGLYVVRIRSGINTMSARIMVMEK